MKLIINTTTLSGTGVTQVAVSFINECIRYSENEYFVFLSKTVSGQINKNLFPKNFHFYEFENHPLYGLKGFAVRKRLRYLEHQIKPDVVFTVFGPACWTPNSKHVTGFANSYYVYPESPFFKKIPMRTFLKIKLMKIAHRFFLKRNGKFFICETDDMSDRLSVFIKVERSQIYTVSNTFNSFFENYRKKEDQMILKEKTDGEVRLLVLASFDIHKNLDIINEVIPNLNKKFPGNNIKFVLTVNPEQFENVFTQDVKSQIINLGRVDVKECPQLYSECDALFLPTLIESFTANYPEAMKMERPILTSHYSFAKTICGDAACYFNPLDPSDIADKILKVLYDRKFYYELVAKGILRVKAFGTARERTERYLNVLNSVGKK